MALESTIISHGMPYPKNVETAIAVEDVLRAHGVMPATIAIIGGRIKIGLTREEIEYMATAENVLKVSRRDFPLTISQGLDGATTVAGTMIAAHMAGIRLFVTGGIGGVHRGAGESFDISADLEELKMTDVTPSETNFGGALLTGTQSACKSACDAFATAVEYVAENPTAF